MLLAITSVPNFSRKATDKPAANGSMGQRLLTSRRLGPIQSGLLGFACPNTHPSDERCKGHTAKEQHGTKIHNPALGSIEDLARLKLEVRLTTKRRRYCELAHVSSAGD